MFFSDMTSILVGHIFTNESEIEPFAAKHIPP